jgi:hypothetical protein
MLAVVLLWTLVPIAERFIHRNDRPPEKPIEHTAQMDWVDKSKGLQILHFYADPAVLRPGQRTSLCYGVAQAKEVQVEPRVDDAWPSFHRCMDAAPKRTTNYILTATDDQGKQMQSAVKVSVVDR